VLVKQEGQALFEEGFGVRDLRGKRKIDAHTNFRLASCTKQFTAMAIMLLVHGGKLRYDETLMEVFPEFPAYGASITVRNLLNHTSGLPDYEDLMDAAEKAKGPMWSPERQIRDDQVLQLLKKESHGKFAPGSQWVYSNSGYVLLGLVVEQASGESLPAFLQQRIFRPLHMDHTLLYVRGSPEVSHRAYGYSEENGAWKRTDQDVTSATRGDGGIYSSIDDMAKWDAALYDDRLLSDASRKVAFSPHAKVTGEPYEASYGSGWRITGDTLWHSGESIGFRNVIVRWPRQHLTVILLSNRNDPEPYRTALSIAEPFLH